MALVKINFKGGWALLEESELPGSGYTLYKEPVEPVEPVPVEAPAEPVEPEKPKQPPREVKRNAPRSRGRNVKK